LEVELYVVARIVTCIMYLVKVTNGLASWCK